MADLSELLALVESLAPKLRAAGVLHLKADGLELQLAPAEPVAEPVATPNAAAPPEDDAEEPADPLDDGFTYGMSKAPGFEALRERRRSSKES